VPNVLGSTPDAATASLQSLGLTASDTQTSDRTESQFGTVVTQDPPAGTAVAQGVPVALGICDAISSTDPVR
jgi:beta-lactam-binding protein with PASTA domain